MTASQLIKYAAALEDPNRHKKMRMPDTFTKVLREEVEAAGPISQTARAGRLGSVGRTLWSTEPSPAQDGQERVPLSEMSLEDLVLQPSWRWKELVTGLIEVCVQPTLLCIFYVSAHVYWLISEMGA